MRESVLICKTLVKVAIFCPLGMNRTEGIASDSFKHLVVDSVVCYRGSRKGKSGLNKGVAKSF